MPGIHAYDEADEARAREALERAKDDGLSDTAIVREIAGALAELREPLRKLADACGQTLPGSAWSNEIDEAIQLATPLIGPMR